MFAYVPRHRRAAVPRHRLVPVRRHHLVTRGRHRLVSVAASMAMVAGMASAVVVGASGGPASAQSGASISSLAPLYTGAVSGTTAALPIDVDSPTVPLYGPADPGSTVTVDDFGFGIATTTVGAGDDSWTLDVNLPSGVQDITVAESLDGATSALSTPIYIDVTDDNLVTNGQFDQFGDDTPVGTGGFGEFCNADTGPFCGTGAAGPIPGWMADDSNCPVIEVQNAYGSYGGGADGNPYYAELASDCVGGIEQTIDTVPGVQYQLQFSYAARPDAAASAVCSSSTYQPYEQGNESLEDVMNSMSVEWGSTYLAGDGGPGAPDPGSDLVGGSGWAQEDYTVTATSDQTTIYFNDTNPCFEDTYGDFLDNVSVIPTVDLEPGNTSWITAEAMTGAGSASQTTYTPTSSQALQFPGEILWYDFQVQPGQQVNVTLNADADYNVYLFSDIYQAFTAEESGTTSLAGLGAESANSAYSNSAFSNSAFSNSAYSNSAYSNSAYSNSAYSNSAFSDAIFANSAFSNSAFSNSAFSSILNSNSAFSNTVDSNSAFSTAYTSAEDNSIVGVSTEQGTVTKTISANSWNDTGNFYVLVTGDNDASSPDAFTLTATTSGTSCLLNGAPLSSYSSSPTFSGNGLGNYSTLVIENSTAMANLYGGDAAVEAMNTELGKLANAENGYVVDLDPLGSTPDTTQVEQLANQASEVPSCPYAENLEAQAIQSIIDSFSTTELKYVVIVGDDDVIPFFRDPDQAGLAPESEYQPPLVSTSAANAALEDNYYLTDDPYGTTPADELDIQGTMLSLPTLAVGRLVETPGDVTNTVSSFMSDGGAITPTDGLATGYSFMASAAESADAAFTTALGSSGSVTCLIDTGTQPCGDAGPWTASTLMSDLESVGAGSGGKGSLVFMGSHFSANNLLAADDTTTLTTNTFAQDIGTQDLANSLVISPGCHSGYNIDPADSIPGVTDPLAWPQAMAEAGATLVAGTGYQYGDTNYTAYSDQVDVDLADQLDYTEGGKAPTIGTALLDAKQQYLSTLFDLSGIEVKALQQITLYGLPMLAVSMKGQTGPSQSGGTGSVMGTATTAVGTVSGGPGHGLDLQSGSYDYSPPSFVSPEPSVGTSPAYTYESYGPGGQLTAVTGGPVLPVQTEDVNVSGDTLRGVVFMGGTYWDTPGLNVLTGDPAADTSNAIIPFSSATFYPQTTWNPNYYNTISGANGGDTELAVTPLQYVSDANGDGNATQREYSSMDFQLFYDNNADATADAAAGDTAYLAAPPRVTGVSSTVTAATSPPAPSDGSTGFDVNITANVTGDSTAGVQEVVATYTGDDSTDPLYKTWASVTLTPIVPGSTTYTGSFYDPGSMTTGAADSEFMVQAVNGAGAVTMDTNGGYYFTDGTDPGAQPPTPVPSYALQFSNVQTTTTDPSYTGSYGGSATVTATLSATLNGTVANQAVTFSLGEDTVVGYTGSSGQATVTIPLDQPPGTYALGASYFNEATGATASAPAGTNIIISQAPTALALTATPAQITSGQPIVNSQTGQPSLTATLTTQSGQLLSQQPVYFQVTNTSTGNVIGTGEGTTNAYGVAASGPITLVPGKLGPGYEVTAYFGQSCIASPGTSCSPPSPTGIDAATVDYGASTSGTAPVTLADSTQSGLTATPNPSNFGQSVTLTDTVSSGNALGTGAPSEGTVTFYDGTGELGTAKVSNGSAVLSVSGAQGGPQTFSATYSDPSANYATSTATTTDNVSFTETISGTHSGALTISKGQLVLVTGKVTGAVSVSSGGGLEVQGGTISGALSSSGALQFTLCGATVGGALSVTGTTGFVFIGGPTGTGTSCSKSTIGGAVSLSANKGGLEMIGSSVGGAMSVTSNSGSGPVEPNGAPVEPELSGNTIGGALACSGNTPGLTDGGAGNKAAVKSGQCAGSF